MEKIDWQKTATAIHNQVRGFNPWPGAYAAFQERNLKLWRTRLLPQELNEFSAAPGEILALTENGFLVAAKEGALEVLEVQPESKRRMTAKEFAAGYQLKPGMILA